MKERKYPQSRPIAIDLFCGAGGMSLGLEQAGFDVALGIDRDGHHIATHERNFPYGKALCAPIEELSGDRIREIVGTEIDLVAGGPPCQGFSHMGLRDINDPRNSLIDHFVRLILEVRPRAFLMENVPGLLSGKTRSILDALIDVAESNGYAITSPVQVLDAANFGVPQQRRRVFVIGVRTDVATFIPYPDGKCLGQPDRPTVGQAISDLPTIENHDELFKQNEVKYDKRPTSAYAKFARGVLKDPSDLSRPRIWKDSICSGCLRTKHAEKSVDLYSATPPGETVPGHKLPRLAPDGIAPTLRAGSDSTHGSYTAPRPIHPVLPRCITSREAARLHGFPDWFSFYPLKWHAYRQIGNAVCPPVARAIGHEIVRVLGCRFTSKAPKAVSLADAFVLPEDRPRSLRRIPQMSEFPPVIDYLFTRAYDSKTQRLMKVSFSFKDVLAAIESTNANLHWVREDTFLAEIARSRRVSDMLSTVHRSGYTIMSSNDGKSIGKFVPVGTPGSIDDKDSLQVRIDEIHEAVSLPLPETHFSGKSEEIFCVLSNEEVLNQLWGRKKISFGEPEKVDSTRAGVDRPSSAVYLVDVTRGRGTNPKPLAIVACKAATLPAKSRIARIADQHDCDETLLLISATSRHFIVVHFAECKRNPKEIKRVAFALES